MKSLPANAVPYKRTSEFTSSTTPTGLLHSHSTKADTWAKIVVLEGTLTYRILEPWFEEVLLSPERFGVVEPAIRHEVVPHAGVRFFVEFYRVGA